MVVLNHMRIHSVGMDASFAGEFGSNVRILYFPEPRDLFLINPVIDPPSPGDESTECHDEIGRELIKTRRMRKIVVHYLTETQLPTRDIFKDREACMIQAILEKI